MNWSFKSISFCKNVFCNIYISQNNGKVQYYFYHVIIQKNIIIRHFYRIQEGRIFSMKLSRIGMLTGWPYFWKAFQKVQWKRSNPSLWQGFRRNVASCFPTNFLCPILLELARLKAVKIPATSSVRCICIRIISAKWLVIDGSAASSSNRIRTDSLLPHSDANNALSIDGNQSRVGSALEIFYICTARHDHR